ncbi:MAG: hypothetical protein AAFO89_13285, partial [Planctomycetota bacterium]
MLNQTGKAALLLAALAATNALGQTTVAGDIVVPAGDTLILSDDTTYTGSLTIEAGAEVVVNAGTQIDFADGATLTVNGTESDPVLLFPISGSWDGLLFQTGSTGTIAGAVLTDFRDVAIEIEDA